MSDSQAPGQALPQQTGGEVEAPLTLRDPGNLIPSLGSCRVPVRAIPREPGHLIGEDDADLAEGDAGDQVPESLTVRAVAPLKPRSVSMTWMPVSSHRGRFPAEVAGALVQRVFRRKLSWLVSTWCGVDWRM